MSSPPSPPLFFWREHEHSHGFLSQWYESAFLVDGVTYQTAEMWMMIQKARLFGDEETAQKMMQTTVPAEHQALGRKARGFERGFWDEHKSRIVEEGNYHKFTKSKEDKGMLRKLLDTGDRELVEASPKDRIWGVGFGAENAEANRKDWGENRLGKAIMNVRQRLRDEGRE
ncbi:hypothetical protein M409DRAFT_22135 [Zasmidium cellare ATCC 36951]|uniref:NADAR domain-containing protein n=1 Tax=Zasmidium cellare ATCC 36951 TaxID=1080233 RepID=A0A6A6CLR7_ZASCE|nr:uncharacterized protein M409DRAFT_22135 [Zasmidium cellare ATCC 36951]KAF2167991.1 hypothetical protein M409DRAFT_22135 [Zasmidium cellare ATCC 36951]